MKYKIIIHFEYGSKTNGFLEKRMHLLLRYPQSCHKQDGDKEIKHGAGPGRTLNVSLSEEGERAKLRQMYSD